jgi:hypothetical protein
MTIREFGTAAHIFRSDSDSELASSAVMDGVGIIGDSTGAAAMGCMTAAGITPEAPRFITGAISTVEAARVAERTSAPAHRVERSMEIPKLLEDTPLRGVRPARAPALSVDITVVDRRGPIRHAEAPAWAVEAFTAAEAVDRVVVAAVVGVAAVAADIGNRSFVILVFHYKS